ncbi:MAG: hypothetical protein PHW73_07630 [Atribacterota bacterium]|nr:hypothetical protein [Atribacterota bacterium]
MPGKKLGLNLLKRKIGGEKGKDSYLTDKAIDLKEKYKMLYRQVAKYRFNLLINF